MTLVSVNLAIMAATALHQVANIGHKLGLCSQTIFLLVYSSCEGNPCQFGGTCIRHGLDNICTCPPATSGDFCEIGMKLCPSLIAAQCELLHNKIWISMNVNLELTSAIQSPLAPILEEITPALALLEVLVMASIALVIFLIPDKDFSTLILTMYRSVQ